MNAKAKMTTTPTWTHIKLTRTTSGIGEVHYQVRDLATGGVVRHIDCGDYEVARQIANRIDANWDADPEY